VNVAVETARPLLDAKRHQLVVNLPAENIRLEADPLRLSQVIGNLLTNAAKYTDPEGHIELGAKLANAELVISIRDDGIGLSEEVMPGLFTMFSQVNSAIDRAEGGLGIGLALVKRLVELHGGSVDVESPPLVPEPDAPAGGSPAGSVFSIHLPALTAGSVVSSAPVLENDVHPAAPPGRLRVLVADDNMDAGESLAMLIEEMGHEARVAQDGAAALAAIHAFRPDVAFVDIGMPKLNGYDVGRRVRAEAWGNQVVLVALTGWGQADDRRQSAEAGFDEHLVKPTRVEVIERVLADVQRNQLANA